MHRLPHCTHRVRLRLKLLHVHVHSLSVRSTVPYVIVVSALKSSIDVVFGNRTQQGIAPKVHVQMDPYYTLPKRSVYVFGSLTSINYEPYTCSSTCVQ